MQQIKGLEEQSDVKLNYSRWRAVTAILILTTDTKSEICGMILKSFACCTDHPEAETIPLTAKYFLGRSGFPTKTLSPSNIGDKQQALGCSVCREGVETSEHLPEPEEATRKPERNSSSGARRDGSN